MGESRTARWAREDGRVAIATVVGTRGSAPRPLGSRMAVSVRGEIDGAVSGGCVEADVVRLAQELLEAGGPARVLSYGAPADELVGIGLPCGGEVDVLLTVERELDVLRRTEPPAPRVLLTGIDPEHAGARLEVDPEGRTAGDERLAALAGAAGDVLRTGRPVLVCDGLLLALAEPLGLRPRLIVVGADDLAEALCAAASRLGWVSVVVDPRSSYATPERVPSAGRLLCAWPQPALERLRPTARCAVVVNTHERRLDLPATLAALRSDAPYVGVLGSRRNAAARLERLLDAGASELELLRLRAPCGLDLGAAGPAETALSILGEVLAVRNSRDGGALQASSAPIHPRQRELRAVER